jgi:predicted nucleic acid-binding protein
VKAILADTGPLYGTVITSDQYHARAQEELRIAQSANLTIIVPYPIIMETYSLLLRRVSPATAQVWLNGIAEGLSILSPTSEDFEDAIQRVQRYKDQKVSLFDALLSSLADRFALPVWTFDHHFDTLGVPVWREG